MPDFEHWEYSKTKIPYSFQPEQRIALHRRLRDHFLQELKSNPAILPFFEPYNEASYGDCLFEYAQLKADMVFKREYYIHALEMEGELPGREMAEHALNLILYKKLFNTECLWRAGREDPGDYIVLYHDFDFWREHIRDCPFLPAVTEDDIGLMMQFLQSGNNNELGEPGSPDEYEFQEVIRKDAEGDYYHIPEWFEFYDGRMGTGVLMQLPDVRASAQKHYRDVWLEHIAPPPVVKPAAPAPAAPAAPARPSFGSLKDMELFSARFDEPEFAEYFRWKANLEQEAGQTRMLQTMDEYAERLTESHMPVELPGGQPLDDALRTCANRLDGLYVAEGLRTVYDEYLLYREVGLHQDRMPDLKAFRNEEWYKDIVDWIIRGRMLLGEPGDLDF